MDSTPLAASARDVLDHIDDIAQAGDEWATSTFGSRQHRRNQPPIVIRQIAWIMHIILAMLIASGNVSRHLLLHLLDKDGKSQTTGVAQLFSNRALKTMHEPESNAQMALAWKRYLKLAYPTIEQIFDEMRVENETEWALGFRAKRRLTGKISSSNNEDEARIITNYVHAQAQMWLIGLSVLMKYMHPVDTIKITDDLESYAYCESDKNNRLSIKISIGQYLSLFEIATIAVQKESLLDFFKASTIVKSSSFDQAPSVNLKMLDYGCNNNTSLTDLSISLDHCGGPTIYSIFYNLPDATESLYDVDNIANSALGWIIAHELAHFHCGHLHYVSHRNVGSGAEISEGHMQTNTLDPDLSAAIEIEADWCATAYFYYTMLTREELFRIFPKDLIENKDSDVLWKSRLIGTSASIAMLSLDVLRKYKGTSTFYPTPKERLFNLSDNILKLAAGNLPDGFFDFLPDCSLTLISGIFADASLVYEEVIQILDLNDRDPLYVDGLYSYGCYAGVICCDHFGAISFETGSPPFYLEGTEMQKFEADNEILNLLARLAGDSNMLPAQKHCNSVPANIIITDIIAHYKCCQEDLEESWLDGVLALSTKNEKMTRAKNIQVSTVKQTLREKLAVINALEDGASSK